MKVQTDTPEEELIKALQAALEAQPDIEPGTITKREYAALRDVSDYTARKELDILMDAGALEASYVMRINAWKERQRVKGYRYVGSN